jgi:hypothetical protein
MGHDEQSRLAHSAIKNHGLWAKTRLTEEVQGGLLTGIKSTGWHCKTSHCIAGFGDVIRAGDLGSNIHKRFGIRL